MRFSTESLRKIADLGLTQAQLNELLSILCEIAEENEERSRRGAERTARYRARRRLTEREWNDLRAQVIDRDNWTCQYCGASELESPHCDHIVPLIAGGTNDLDNLACACRECNTGKGGRTLEQWRGA
jgi:5-methylcytosine-specific restriction endonuclease McrA